MKAMHRWGCVVWLSLVLVACGGGPEGSSNNSNQSSSQPETDIIDVSDSLQPLRFYEPINLSSSEGHTYAPAIASSSDGDVYAIWHDNSFGGMEVLLSRSNDYGESFSTPINLSNSTGLSTFADVQVSPANNRVFAFWQDNVAGDSQIYLTWSRDNGGNWSTPSNISQSNEAAVLVDADIAEDGDILVSWSTSSSVVVAKSSDGGDSFQISGSFPVLVQQISKVTAGRDGRVYLVYQALTGDNVEIMYSVSSDDGASFSEPRVLSQGGGVNALSPAIVADASGTVYISWTKDFSEASEIYMVVSKDDGETFSSVRNITNNDGISIGSDLHVGKNGRLYVTWQDTSPGNYEAMAMFSDDEGVTFTEQLNIAPSDTGSLVTKLTVDSYGRIFIVWDDNRYGPFEAILSMGYPGLSAVDKLSVSPELFTPNGDGDGDLLNIEAEFTNALNWQVDVLNSADVSVARWTGSGDLLMDQWGGLGNSGLQVADGDYVLQVSGTDANGLQALSRQASFILATAGAETEPTIEQLIVDPEAFGPDGDGRQEEVFIDARFNKTLEWQLQFINSNGEVVNSQSGTNLLIDTEWDGRDREGNWVPEGSYQVLLTATDGLQSIEQSLSVVVDTILPVVSNLTIEPEIFTPNSDGIEDNTTISFHISEGAVVTVYLYEQGGVALVNELFRGAFDTASTVSVDWDGTTGGGASLGNGIYDIKIWVRDFAANQNDPYPIDASVVIQ